MTDYFAAAIGWLSDNAWALAIVTGGIIGVLILA